jgi:hypothetical protein
MSYWFTETQVGNATPFSSFLPLKMAATSLQLKLMRKSRPGQCQGGAAFAAGIARTVRLLAPEENPLVDEAVSNIAHIHDLGSSLAGIHNGGDGLCKGGVVMWRFSRHGHATAKSTDGCNQQLQPQQQSSITNPKHPHSLLQISAAALYLSTTAGYKANRPNIDGRS